MKLFLSIIIIFSLTLQSKITYKVIENSNSINITIDNIDELGTGDASIYEHLPINESEKGKLTLPLALEHSNIANAKGTNANLEFADYGKLQGVDITKFTISVIDYNLDSCAINIQLKESIGLATQRKIPNKLKNVLNKKHLAYQLSAKKRSKNELQSDFSSWMQNGKDYLKIGTNKVGITKISGNEVLPYLGSNRAINSIHFIKDGELYKYFYIRSSDNILSSDDEIYLLTQHQYGDSTYYDHQTDWKYFYMLYDEQRNSERLSSVSSLPPNQEKLVIQNLRFEEDREYSFGVEPWEIEATNYEGWFQKVIAPLNGEPETGDFYVDVILPESGNVQIRSFFAHLYFLEFNSSKHENLFNLDFSLNNELIENTGEYRIDPFSSFDNFYKDLYTYESSEHNLINGPNKLSITTYQTTEFDASRVGIDYYTVRQPGIPVAYNGNAQIEKITNGSSQIPVYNFNSNEIIAIDSANSTIQIANGLKADVFSGGITKNFVGLKINNERFYSDITENNSYLFYYLIFNKSTKNFKSGFTNNINEFIGDINGNISAIAINNGLDQSAINTINNQFNLNISSSDKAILYLTPDSENKSFTGSQSASGHYFYRSNQAENFYANIILQNNDSEIFISDSENFSDYRIEGNIKNKPDLTNYSDAEVLVIYHNEMQNFVDEWTEYRTSQGFKIRSVEVHDIYNEFSFGRVTPYAIKDYLYYAYKNWSEDLEYVYLIGDATWDPKKLMENSVSNNQIPVFGRPYSDMWYAMLDTSNQRRFDLSVTRLSAHKNEEAIAYLNKVKAFESMTPKEWFKDFLVLVGGYDNERASFLDWSNEMVEEIVQSPMNIDTLLYVKSSSDAIEVSSDNFVPNAINNGVMWTNFLGHGAFDAVDIGGWSTEKINNNFRTGILSTVSCNNGAFAEPSSHRSRNEDQLLVPEKGYVGVFGGTASGEVISNSLIMKRLFNYFIDTNITLRRPSDILYLSLDGLSPSYDTYALTYNFIGDPLLNIPLSESEDYLFLSETLEIQSNEGDEIINVDSDSTKIFIKPFNVGYHLSDPNIIAIHNYQDNYDTINVGNFENYWENGFNIYLNTKDKPGEHNIEFIIDPDNISRDDNFENNSFSFAFDVFDKNLIPFDPLNEWNLSSKKIIRFFNPYFSDHIDVEVEILDSFENIVFNNNNLNVDITNKTIDIDLNNIDLEDNRMYKIKYRSKLNNDWSNYNILEFFTTNSPENIVKYEIINNNSKYYNLEFNSDRVYFDTNYRTYEIESYNGIETPHAGANFFLDGQLAMEQYGFGFYIGTLNKYDVNAKPKIRHFNTDGWFYPAGEPAYFIDSLNFKLLDYLRDSISTDEYIFLATGGPIQRQFEIYCNNDYCSKDTLVTYLKNIGINDFTSDNVDGELGLAYFGGYQVPEFVQQQKITRKVLSEIEGTAPIYSVQGEISSQLIGPAISWKKLNLNYLGNPSGTITISDRNNKLIEEYALNEIIDLSDLDYEYLIFKINLKRQDEKDYVVINEFSVEFKPIPEIGLSFANISEQNELLRGDDYEVEINVNNYSLRTNSSSFNLNYIVNNSESNVLKEIDNISPNNSYNFKSTINTGSLFDNNNLSILLEDDYEDYFSFNNSINSQFKLNKDTIKPNILLKVDGNLANDGDFISKSSKLIVEFYDNSKLPIDNLNSFTLLRFNGFLNREEIEFENNFDHNETGGLKARITLPNDRIIIGDNRANLVHIVGSDAANNIDTLFLYLNVSELGRVFNLINYPNPFTSSTTIKFELIALEIDENTTAKIQIYDGFGNFIRELDSDLNIGINETTWDGKDSRGNSIPSGRYYYVIMIKSDTFFPETDAGISIKIK